MMQYCIMKSIYLCVNVWLYVLFNVVGSSLVPRPLPSFLSLAVQLSGRRPSTVSHVSDVTGRKTVERL